MDTTGHITAALNAAKADTKVRFELEYTHMGARLYADLPDGSSSVMIAPVAGGRWQATLSTVGADYVPSVSEIATGAWDHVAERVIGHLTGNGLELHALAA